jgi:predicted secreted protein
MNPFSQLSHLLEVAQSFAADWWLTLVVVLSFGLDVFAEGNESFVARSVIECAAKSRAPGFDQHIV